MDVGEGDAAPDFTLQTASGESVSLSGYPGKPVLVYFYPKADTPQVPSGGAEQRTKTRAAFHTSPRLYSN